MSLSETIIDLPAEHEKNVFGQFDMYAKKTGESLSRDIDPKRRAREDHGRIGGSR